MPPGSTVTHNLPKTLLFLSMLIFVECLYCCLFSCKFSVAEAVASNKKVSSLVELVLGTELLPGNWALLCG